MVVTTPDGTTFTINTNDVDEVKFSNGQVTVSGTTIQGLIDRIDDLQWYLQMQIDAYNDLLSRINSCHCTTVDLTGITTDIDNLNDSITVHRTDINTLQTALTNGLNYINDLLYATGELNDEIRTLTETDAALKIAITNLTAQVVANGLTITDIQKRIDDLSDQVPQNTNDISWLKYFYNNLQGCYNLQQATIDEQQATIDAQQQRITSLEDYVKALETRMATLEDVIQSTQQ